MLTIRMMEVDTWGLIILMGLWAILGLAGTLTELSHDRSTMDEEDFLPEIDRHSSSDVP